jgi:hypothetical protein
VDAQAARLSVDGERFELRDVVAHVVDHADAGAIRSDAERDRQALADPVRHDLAVGEREIGGGHHRREVVAPFRRRDRRARELPVRQRDAVLAAGIAHHAQVIGADLVAEPARAAVDHHGDLIFEQSESRGDPLVEDFRDVLELGEMIARSQRAELRLSALAGAIRHQIGIGAGDAAALLDRVEILRTPEPLRHGPRRASFEHAAQILARHAEILAMRADTGRHVAVHLRHDRVEVRRDLLAHERRPQQPHAAIDVVADAARRHHAVVRVHGRDAANRKSVAPMNVGQRDRRADDAGEVRDVAHLLQALVLLDVLHHPLVGVDDAVDAHPAGLRQTDSVGIYSFNTFHVSLR